MPSERLTALGYLVGAGSFNLGVEAAGYKLQKILETPGYSKNAASWDLNRPDLQHSILELDHTSTIFKRWPGLDLIYGNPPCGGVSAMTGSNIGSVTNACMRQWMRMVVHARPRAILMENGYQLATERLKPLLMDLTNILDDHGYWWWTWMFYSYQLGTPQVRRRMFLCASLDSPKRPDLIGLEDLPDQRNRGNAPTYPWLWDLEGVEPSPKPVVNKVGKEVTQHFYGTSTIDRVNALLVTHRERLLKPYLAQKDWDRAKRRADLGDAGAEEYLRKNKNIYWPECPREFTGMSCHRPCKVDYKEATGTILGSYRYVHPVDPRMLTMREMARLMGFPEWFRFHALMPHLIAQGIPVINAYWAAKRLAQTIGLGEEKSNVELDKMSTGTT